MNGIPFDTQDIIADFINLQERSMLARTSKENSRWWDAYIPKRADVLTKFVKSFIEKSSENTEERLSRFSQTPVAIQFDLHIKYLTVQTEKLSAIAKIFPNASCVYYERPYWIEPKEYLLKEAAGLLTGAKFLINAVSNAGRALPCVKAIGKELSTAAEQGIRYHAQDTVLQQVHALFPKINQLFIRFPDWWGDVNNSSHIARGITDLPLFSNLKHISISSSSRSYIILDLGSSTPSLHNLFCQYSTLKSLDISEGYTEYDKNIYNQFKDTEVQFQFKHIPEELTSLSVNLLPKQDSLKTLLARCKNLSHLRCSVSWGRTLFPETPYPSLKTLAIKDAISNLQVDSQAIFTAFPNLNTLDINESANRRDSLQLQQISTSRSLQHLIIDVRRHVQFLGFNVKTAFPKLETMTVSWGHEDEDEDNIQIPDGMELAQEAPLDHGRTFYVFRVI